LTLYITIPNGNPLSTRTLRGLAAVRGRDRQRGSFDQRGLPGLRFGVCPRKKILVRSTSDICNVSYWKTL